MRFSRFLGAMFILITAFSACKKNSASFDTTPSFYIVNGGASNAGKGLILFPAADTITYNLIISSTYILPKETIVTLEAADSYRQSYNSANGTNYNAMPANGYSFQTTVTAAAGGVYDTIPVTFYKKNLQANNYMLPISIKTVSNYKIDTSLSVIYLNTLDNQLSGIYSSKISKFLYIGDAADGNLNSTDTFSITKYLIPVSDTSSEMDYADLGANGWKYELTFNFDLNIFTVAPNSVIESSISDGSFNVIDATFNPITKDIYIKTSYKNTSGNERIVEESLTLQ